jgi:hypothetical protein|tara:strand:- start:538 stop:825 length:288 start_codon:yes stop_codon:yes gene_type:complete
MPRNITINGVTRQMTDAEEATLNAEETAWNNAALDRALQELRDIRNGKLAETDYLGNSDITMNSDMTTYRQNLRDLPDGLDTVEKVNNVTWPTKP